MTPGVRVQHRNGLLATVENNDGRSFSVVWDNAGVNTYPARTAKEFEQR